LKHAHHGRKLPLGALEAVDNRLHFAGFELHQDSLCRVETYSHPIRRGAFCITAPVSCIPRGVYGRLGEAPSNSLERISMNSPSTTITAVEPATVRQWITDHKDLVVIDVRSPAEFEALHIRGSYNVPLPLVSEHTEQL